MTHLCPDAIVTANPLAIVIGPTDKQLLLAVVGSTIVTEPPPVD